MSEDICEDQIEKRCTPARCDYNVKIIISSNHAVVVIVVLAVIIGGKKVVAVAEMVK